MSIRIASKEALKSTFKQHRLGAVIVKGHRILSTGYNEKRYSKLINRPTLHAEASAVLKLLKENRLGDLAGSTIYVSRFTRGGRIGMALPCRACHDLLSSVGVSRVVYTLDGGGVGTLEL